MAKIRRACRGDGVAFLEVADLCAHKGATLCSAEGNKLPCACLDTGTDRGVFVFPLVRTRGYMFTFKQGNAQQFISSAWLALRSKLTYAVERSYAASLRDCDRSEHASCISVRFTQVVEDGQIVVVRAAVDIPHSAKPDAQLALQVVDATGFPIERELFILEDCAHALSDNGFALRRVSIALRLPIDDHGVGVVASVDDGYTQCAGCMLLDDTYAALRFGFLDATKDAAHDPAYQNWWLHHKICDELYDEQKNHSFTASPYFSIIVPLFCTPLAFFEYMYASVCAQSYERWQLVLVNASPPDSKLTRRLKNLTDKRVVLIQTKNEGIAHNTNVGILAAAGDYLCFLDHDDALARDALFAYAQEIESHPTCDLIYCDEDRFTGRMEVRTPFFKPDYSPELLRAHNYITHFLCVSKTAQERIGLMDARFDGAQDYDFILRISECARCISHIPRVLYHWRIHAGSTSAHPQSKSYASEAGRAALQAHCDRIGMQAYVHQTSYPFAYQVIHRRGDFGGVDIVIPTKDNAAFLRRCVTSLLTRCTYQNYRITLVENNSCDPATFACYDELLLQDKRIRLVRWNDEFNYSRIINFGAQQATKPYLLFLNNDTEVITPDFLETMLGYASDKGVGVVGAKLLFADQTIQHAGVGVGLFDGAAHLFTSLPGSAGGYFERACLPQNLSAVTGAVQLVRKEVFDQVGGYTEDFAIGYNDVDFCLKVRHAGYRIVYTPYAQLTHYEFASRGRDVYGQRMERVKQETALLQRRWPRYFKQGDPYLNPNLSRTSQYCALGQVAP